PPSPAYRPPFPRRPFNTPARRSGRPHLPDLSQMSGPWASAATPAAKVTHLKERLQRLSHTNGRRLPASRSLGPPHQARLPRSAPEFRPSLVAEAVVENLGLVRRPSHWPLQPAG